MKFNQRNLSAFSLILGMTFLVIGITTDNKLFSGAAITFILISLFAGGRWMRKRK